MARSRPELPSDPEPVGRDDDGSDPKKKRSRKRREEETDEASVTEPENEDVAEADVESTDLPESAETLQEDPDHVRREIAEAAFRERVALAEVAGRLSPEAYASVERALAGRSVEWRLEKGRYLFAFLVGERKLPSVGGARIEQKLTLHRERPPVEPERVDELVTEAIVPDEPLAQTVRRLEPLRAELPPGDEIRIRIRPDQPEIIITAESVTAGSEEVVADKITETTPDQLPDPTPETVERLVTEIEREPEELQVGADSEPREHDVPSETSDAEVRKPEKLEPDLPDLASVLELLEREAVDLNDLPPIRGGAPEPGESVPSDQTETGPAESPESPEQPPPPEQPELPEQPAPEGPVLTPPVPEVSTPSGRRVRRARRQTRHVREVLRWDPDSAEVVRYPDHAMRRKARKLVRRMAAEYGVKLTPLIEAYLLGIVLQPHLINGRRVYSIGMNVETLISVLQVLKYNFNLTRRPPV